MNEIVRVCAIGDCVLRGVVADFAIEINGDMICVCATHCAEWRNNVRRACGGPYMWPPVRRILHVAPLPDADRP